MNKVFLIGRLGKDPEIRTTPNLMKVCKFTVATEEPKKKTDWHNVVAFGKTAEFCSNYLRKGFRVIIEGKLSYNENIRPDGTKSYFTNIIAQNVKPIDWASKEERSDNDLEVVEQKLTFDAEEPLGEIPF